MAKGVIDGAMVPWEGVPQAKLQEVAKSHLDVPAGQPKFANSIFAFVMNQAKYDSLPADLKKVIDNNTGIEASALAGEKFDAVVVPYHKLATDRGNQVSVLSSAELARWTKATAEIDDLWVKEVSAKGANGAALLEQARALIKQYDQ
jgi:TRAP-type C4-dicarboxylate transport system substrate-binding protein